MQLELTYIAPPSTLQPFVRECYLMRADTGAVVRDEFYASGVCEVVFNAGLRFHRGERGRSAKLIGQIIAPLGAEVEGRGLSLGLVLTPRGARALTGGSVARFNDRAVPLVELTSPALADAVVRALEHDDVGEALARVSGLFARRRGVCSAAGLEELAASLAHVDVQLEAGASPAAPPVVPTLSARQLQRLYREYVGIPLAHYRRVRRFDRFLAALSRHPREQLTDLAYASGYYDQAHCIREVRRISGLTPGRLRARERAFASAYDGPPPRG